jgi:geranylgeranyl reductase family protein
MTVDQPGSSSPARLDGRHWDVAIVGAGPAGTTAAHLLAKEGHAVLLLDRARFPRDKACGDALIPDALNSLRRLGLYEKVRQVAQQLDTLSAYSPAGIRVDIPGEFLTVRRVTLDALLLQDAVDSGATFHVAPVVSIDSRADRVHLTTRDGLTVTAKVGIVATGADTSLFRGGPTPRPSGPSAVALRCYVRSPVSIDRLIISYDRSIVPGYAWIFPLGDGLYNVGCGIFYRHERQRRVNLRKTFATFVETIPDARDLWQARSSTTSLVGARLRCGLDASMAYNGARVIGIGEVIATTFPFTGEGIGKAMETGEIAAASVAESLRQGTTDALASFPTILQRRVAPRYRGYRRAENWIAQHWLADLVARRVQRSPSLGRVAAGILSETEDPRALFSWKVMLPSLRTWRSARRSGT